MRKVTGGGDSQRGKEKKKDWAKRKARKNTIKCSQRNPAQTDGRKNIRGSRIPPPPPPPHPIKKYQTYFNNTTICETYKWELPKEKLI